MEKTLFIITVAVVTAANYEELMRPASDKVKEYTVSVEAETVEKAELIAGKIIAGDPEKFDKATQYIKIVDAKLASGARPIYKDDNIDYRQLQRALRRYHMWPYATRTVELAIDNCVYKGMTPDAAAKWIYEHPEGIATSPNRDAQGDELTALQMMYTELKRKEGVRFEKMQNPEQKADSEPTEKKEPLYPNAGLERYIQQNPEVAKKMADCSRPERVVTIENESTKEENTMDNTRNEMHDVYDDMASLDATLGKGNKRIQVSFNIRQHGNTVPMTRYITCLDHEARVRLNCQTKKESTDLYTGSLFQDNVTKQKIGSWKWDIGWDYPILFINKQMYSCKVDKDGNPMNNVSVLIMAMVDALKERGIKTTGKYKSSYMKSHVAVMTADTTGLPDYYSAAPNRVENIRPVRTVTGTAKIKTAPAPETNNDLPKESAFFGEAI